MVTEELRETVEFDRKRPDIYGDVHPKELIQSIQENPDALTGLDSQHIMSAKQFNKDMLLQLFRLAARFEANPKRYSNPLKGKILISAFYEPSTRTRLSFESAWHRMGGDIMSITDRATTGMAKGEALSDIGEMFNNYGDCVVLRDVNSGSVYQMAQSLRIPIINAGNGVDEHPTQALADLYTILKWRPALVNEDCEKIRIGIVGLPNRMRTVRSLLIMLGHFSHAFEEVVVIHDGKRQTLFADGQLEDLQERGLNVRESVHLREELPQLDVVYINAIVWEKDNYQVMNDRFRLDRTSPLKDSAIVLHPLARGDELDTSLDDTHHNWYFAQARGAVFVRQALLTCLVQRTDRVMDII